MHSFWEQFKNPGTARHLQTGAWGEERAEQFLRARGYTVVGRRVRVGRRDEIDLIMRERDVLVFVEVKTRANERMGRPFAHVSREKSRNISRAAMRYMLKLKNKPPYFRFDVVEVIGKIDAGDPVIRHIPNAFVLPRWYRVPW
jgi:putative endonuclease